MPQSGRCQSREWPAGQSVASFGVGQTPAIVAGATHKNSLRLLPSLPRNTEPGNKCESSSYSIIISVKAPPICLSIRDRVTFLVFDCMADRNRRELCLSLLSWLKYSVSCALSWPYPVCDREVQ